MIKPAASFVIPTRNRADELRQLLRSLMSQTISLDIHVMDDGDGGETARMVRCEFPQAHYHQLGTGRGPAFQRNRGIRLASAQVVFAVDDDTLFTSPRTVEQTV